MSSMEKAKNSHWSDDCEVVVLNELLSLIWSYNSCASCSGVWAVSDWKMEHIVIGSGQLYNLLSIVSYA